MARRLKVAANCMEWQEESARYHRKDGLIVKTNDDLLSATRVGKMQLRSGIAVALGSTRRERSGVQQVAHAIDDWDVC